MSIYKRGNIYWYKFVWQGKLVRESTKQGNDKVARQMDAAHRTSVAKGQVGIREKKPIPVLRDFATSRVLPWAESTYSSRKKTWLWYRHGIRSITSYEPLAQVQMDEVRGELIAAYVSHRQTQELAVSSIIRELQVLRRILRLAVEWGVLEHSPQVRMLSGERHREFVLSPEEERKFLAAAPEVLCCVATILVDTGMRPEECYQLRWESVDWMNGRNGTLLVTHGKTAAARRVLPMSSRVRNILENRWKASGRLLDGWVWPAPTHSGRIESSSLKKQHSKALKLSRVRPFVLYSLRHTFLTRLGQSGCDAWTLARIAGHSSVVISARYVHPSEDAVFAALDRMGGHKIRHNGELARSLTEQETSLTAWSSRG